MKVKPRFNSVEVHPQNINSVEFHPQVSNKGVSSGWCTCGCGPLNISHTYPWPRSLEAEKKWYLSFFWVFIRVVIFLIAGHAFFHS
jgi:hypothetical protein